MFQIFHGGECVQLLELSERCGTKMKPIMHSHGKGRDVSSMRCETHSHMNAKKRDF